MATMPKCPDICPIQMSGRPDIQMSELGLRKISNQKKNVVGEQRSENKSCSKFHELGGQKNLFWAGSSSGGHGGPLLVFPLLAISQCSISSWWWTLCVVGENFFSSQTNGTVMASSHPLPHCHGQVETKAPCCNFGVLTPFSLTLAGAKFRNFKKAKSIWLAYFPICGEDR